MLEWRKGCLLLTPFIVASVVASACGSSPPAPAEVPELSPKTGTIKPVPVGAVERPEVERTVDAGLGAFLQRLSVEPVLEGERFVGFRLVHIQPGVIRQGVDVQVGDVVTRANGRSLETEVEVFEVFQSLKSAPDIRLGLLRNGQPKDVVIPIIGEPSVSAVTEPGDAGTAG